MTTRDARRDRRDRLRPARPRRWRRRLDLAASRGDPSAATDALVRRGAVPDPASASGRARDPRRRARPRRRRGPRREPSASVAAGRTAGSSSSRDDLRAARDRLEPPIRRALDQAIDHVRRFAETQRPASTRTTIAPGIEIERRWTPLGRVGAYVPGGSAPYPSSLVMTVVPARVAGVGAVVVASPADRDGRDRPGPARRGRPPRGRRLHRRRRRPGDRRARVRAARTPASHPVDRIVGPGNAWVTAAKIEVCGEVGIDLPAGPSEGMVLADAAGRPRARRGRPHHPGRARPGLAGDPGHDRRRPSPTRSRRRSTAQLASAARRDILAAALRDHGRIVLAPDLDAAIDFVNAYAPGAPVGRRRAARADGRPPPQRRLAVRRAVGARNRPATTRPARTTSCRPAAWPARPARWRSRRSASSSRSSASTATGLASIRDDDRRRWPRPRACSPTATPSRSVSTEDRGHDEPDAGHVHLADRPGRRTRWEATDERGRGPLRRRSRRRSSGSTSTPPPPRRRSSSELLAAGRFEAPLSEYPPTDYRRLSRRPPPATASTRPSSSSVPARTRSSTSWPRPSSRPAAAPSSRSPTYAMYRVLTEQRGGTVVAVPRLGEPAGFALDAAGHPRGRRATRRRGRLAVQPEQPDRPGRAGRRDRGAPRGARPTMPPRPAASRRSSSSTRRTPSSSGRSLIGLRDDYPNLIVVRTASKAYALAGLRVGFAVARPELIARLNPYRPPGSVSTVSVTSSPRRCSTRRSSTRTSPASRASGPACATRCARSAGRSGRR